MIKKIKKALKKKIVKKQISAPEKPGCCGIHGCGGWAPEDKKPEGKNE